VGRLARFDGKPPKRRSQTGIYEAGYEEMLNKAELGLYVPQRPQESLGLPRH
jgi:hypothetical protein